MFNLLGSYADLRAELRFPTHGLRYASEMVAYPVEPEGRRIPVLCGHGMGSYLSFNENGNFRPLLDSGLSHFSDDTKRYFFFVWYEPKALDLALKQLHVDYILLDLDTLHWIPTIRLLPDWQFVTCSANGMIWKRSPIGPQPLSEADKALIARSIEVQLQKGFTESAFDYSTLIDPPGKSLALLAGHQGRPWTEGFFNSLCTWVNMLSPADAAAFLATDSCAQQPLVGAIVAERAGPEAYDRFAASQPEPPPIWFWKAIRVEALLRKGDAAEARRVFDSISPTPPSSTMYYRLWHELHAQDSPAPDPGAYGRWQTWDASGPVFMEDMSVRLNNRIEELDRKP